MFYTIKSSTIKFNQTWESCRISRALFCIFFKEVNSTRSVSLSVQLVLLIDPEQNLCTCVNLTIGLTVQAPVGALLTSTQQFQLGNNKYNFTAFYIMMIIFCNLRNDVNRHMWEEVVAQSTKTRFVGLDNVSVAGSIAKKKIVTKIKSIIGKTNGCRFRLWLKSVTWWYAKNSLLLPFAFSFCCSAVVV